MKFWKLILIISVFFFQSKIQAQEQVEDLIEKRLESILENSEENIEASDLFERLFDLASNPINLNSSDLGFLLKFQLINDKQYFSILNYRKIVGKIHSVQEIQFLDGFTKEISILLNPFIYAGEKSRKSPNLSKILRYAQHQFFIRYNQILQAKDGYKKVSQPSFLSDPNKFYLGSPAKIYTRYKFEAKKYFSAAFVLEKDPGEILIKSKYNLGKDLINTQIPVIDFSSFHLSASNIGIVKKLVLGDYHLQFAQGLTLWSNFAFNKSAEVNSVKRYASNIIPSTSSIENNFFRGLAITLEIDKINLSIFYSDKKRDANISEVDDSGEIASFTSLQNTGLHQNINALNDRNSLSENIFGARVSFKSNTFQLGSTAYLLNWNALLVPSEQLYKISNLAGTNNSCVGFDFQHLTRNASYYGEISMSKNGGLAHLLGLNYHADSYSKFSILWRNYQTKYQNFYANAFAENTSIKNEKGLYVGFENSFLPKWKLQFYVDVFKSPWLKSTTDAPSNGLDYFIQINHKASENFQIYLRYKHKRKQVNYALENWFSEIIYENKESLRLNLQLELAKNIRLKSRIEWVKYSKEHSRISDGMLIYQQVEFTHPNNVLKLYFRFTNFNTDDFDSRIYTYENDVLYAFSIPAFYDVGNRVYLLLNYKLNKTLHFWFKIGHTNYKNKERLGTGNEKINGSSKTEIKFQLRLKI